MHIFKCAAVAALLLVSHMAEARLQIFACEPEWAALAEELGGSQVVSFSATSAMQDPHHIEARPALISRLRRADLVVCTGAGLEAGWLPMLQRRANNMRTAPGSQGYFEASAFVDLREKPARLDRADGDVHAQGNPHIQLDPHNIATVAQALAERLAQLDSDNAEIYSERADNFLRRWMEAVHGWEERGASLKGMQVVVDHAGWVYLEEWLGLKRIATLEPKPGIPPSSGHLAKVLAAVQAQPAAAVLYAAYQDKRSAQWLAARAAIEPVKLPYTVGGSAQARDLFALFDQTLDLLLEVQQ